MMNGFPETHLSSKSNTKLQKKSSRAVCIDDLCLGVEKWHLLMPKQPRTAQYAKPFSQKWNRKVYYASQSRETQEWCVIVAIRKVFTGMNAQTDQETNFHTTAVIVKYIRLQNSLFGVARKKIIVQMSPDLTKQTRGGPSQIGKVMFVQKNNESGKGETVAAFKGSVIGETLTKQQRIQNDIENYAKPHVKTIIEPRNNPDIFHERRRERTRRRKGASQKEKPWRENSENE